MNYKNICLPNIIYKKPVNKKSIILYKNVNNSDFLSIITPELKILEINNDNIICKLLDNNDIDFIEKLKELDQLNISNTYFNSNEWFNKDIPIDLINKFYNSSIDNNKIKFNFKKENNVLKLEYIIDNYNNYLEINNLKVNDNIKMKILYNGILFKKTEFNSLIYIQSIKINNKQNNIFISDDELSNSSDDEDYLEEYFSNDDELKNNNNLKNNNEVKNNDSEDNNLEKNYLENNDLENDDLEKDNDLHNNNKLKYNNTLQKNNIKIKKNENENFKLSNDFIKIKNKYNK